MADMSLATATAVGAGFGMVGSFIQGQSNAAAAKYNANVANKNADLAINRSVAQARSQQIQAAQFMGTQRANYAASGISLEGSAMDVLQASAKQAEFEKQTLLYNGQVEAQQSRNTAKFYNAQANSAMVNGIVGGLAKGVLGYAQMQSSFGSGQASSNNNFNSQFGFGDYNPGEMPAFNYAGSWGNQ